MKTFLTISIASSFLLLSSNLAFTQSIRNTFHQPAGFKSVQVRRQDENTIPKFFDTLSPQNFTTQNPLYSLFTWPIEYDIDNGVAIVNYVDDDPTSGIHDYENGPIAYDGHNGTDITLYDFHLMDRGAKVFAATGGTVVETSYDKFDRRIGLPFPDDGNYVFLLHTDGTYSYYYHLRKNSVTVNVGDTVTAGQMLGLAGSSGFSYGPHLHFGAAGWDGSNFVARDPWHGMNQPLPTLWHNQKPYLTSYPFKVVDMSVFTQAAAGGDIYNIPTATWLEKISQPAVFGANEPYIAFFVNTRCAANDSFTVQLLRPDNSIYSSYTWAPLVFYTIASFYFVWYFNGYVFPADYGTWTARVLHGATTAGQMNFQVGATTVYGPRFFPLAGRSFHLNGNTQRDTLRVSSFGGSATYSLLNAPPFVSLSDSLVILGGTSAQTNRSLYFQAVATDGAGRRDTMRYHVVDSTKPLDPHSISVIHASVKVLLEGPYNIGTLTMNTTLNANGTLASHFAGIGVPSDAVDSMTLELRDAASSPSLRKFKPAWLLSDGTIRGFTDTTANYTDFDVSPGNYYLVVWHRNHLPIMTAASQALSNGVPALYDFTTSQSQAYGTNPMKQLGSRFAMIAGDGNGSGIVSAADANLVFGVLNAVGYNRNDMNLSGIVSAADANVVFGNLNRSSQVP